MITLTVPMLDATSKLTPLVFDAIANGATSANNPDDKHTFLLTFENEEDAAPLQKMLEPKPAKRAKGSE